METIADTQDQIFTTKEKKIESILLIIFSSFFALNFFLVFTKNTFLSLTLSLVILIIAYLYKLITFTTYFLDSNGLTLKKKIGNQTILWNDIISMATVSRNDTYSYEIKTKLKTYRIPIPKDFHGFEKYIEKHTKLEMFDKNTMWSSFFIKSVPEMKRWRKVGQEYQNTSFSDLLSDPGYTYQKKLSLKK